VPTRAFGAAALIALLASAAPAFAQDADGAVPECRAMLRDTWADVVRADRPGNPPVITLGPAPSIAEPADTAQPDPLRAELARMAEICAGDRLALADIMILDAQRSRYAAEPERALELLARADLKPGERSFGLHRAEVLKASTTAGRIMAAWPAILDEHEALLLASGMTLERTFTVQGIALRAYAHKERTEGWLLIGLRPNGELETIAAGEPGWSKRYGFEEGKRPFALTNARCTTSNQPFADGETYFDESVTLDRIITFLENSYGDPGRDANRNDLPGIPDFCPNLRDMLPGFGPVSEFLGVEYRDRSAGYSDIDLTLALQGDDAAERHAAADYLFDHPDAIEPINLIYGIVSLIERGDMERATFWYFIWQTRTRPWMAADSNIAQLRGALASGIGPTLLEWAGSDYDAMLALWRRAIRYELQFPLHPRRPGRIGEAEWQRMVALAREENSEANMLGSLPSKAEYEAGRAANGLPVGPWVNPGRPLKDDWR
jgi:hypothetical protein